MNTPFLVYFKNYLECFNALGMEDGTVSDEQITASSQWNANEASHQGRLYFHKTLSKAGGWVVSASDLSQWLQIDLGSLYTKTTRVATQGRNGAENWVTKYKLKFSNDGVNFTCYREPGESYEKVKSTPKLITLDLLVTVTFVITHQLQRCALTVLVIAMLYNHSNRYSVL